MLTDVLGSPAPVIFQCLLLTYFSCSVGILKVHHTTQELSLGPRPLIKNFDHHYRTVAAVFRVKVMDIIIVGAGIAGLGAGIALRRAGHKVTVGIPSLTVTLTSKIVQDSRAVIVAARGRSGHHDQA
jgi:hypothetical protein